MTQTAGYARLMDGMARGNPNRRKPEHLRQGLTFFFPSLCDISLEITARFLDMSGQVQNK